MADDDLLVTISGAALSLLFFENVRSVSDQVEQMIALYSYGRNFRVMFRPVGNFMARHLLFSSDLFNLIFTC